MGGWLGNDTELNGRETRSSLQGDQIIIFHGSPTMKGARRKGGAYISQIDAADAAV